MASIASRGRSRLPCPIPYQGSKRLLAPRILAVVERRRFRRFYEPCAGSAALTLAAARAGLAQGFSINDSLSALAAIWERVITRPRELARDYERMWRAQLADPARFYRVARDEYNRAGDPALLLYLLARCAKNAPRFNRWGAFNQSPDNRRLGMRPERMRAEIEGASRLLEGRTATNSVDFVEALACATPDDLVYLDPPYEGTTVGTDTRYHQGLPRERLIAALHDLNRRGVPFLLSYDGRMGARTYGPPLPESIRAERLELVAGRSSQATLLGRKEITVESLYVSHSLLR